MYATDFTKRSVQFCRWALTALAVILGAEAANAELLIRKATYGAEQTRVDVTALVREKVTAQSLSMEISNEKLGGDPCFGKPKELVLEYTSDQGTFVISLPEGSNLSISRNARDGVVVSGSQTETTVQKPKAFEPIVFPVLKVGEKELRNVKVVGVLPSGIRVIHDEGAGVLDYKELPSEIQKRFGYNAEEAKIHRKVLDDEQRAALSTIESEKRAVSQFEKGGGQGSQGKPDEWEPVRLMPKQLIAGYGTLCAVSRSYVIPSTEVYKMGRLIKGKPAQLKWSEPSDAWVMVKGFYGNIDPFGKTHPYNEYIRSTNSRYHYVNVFGEARSVIEYESK